MISLRGGAGACSEESEIVGKDKSPPRGPRGSREPSIASRRGACTPTFRAGVFRGAAGLEIDVVGAEDLAKSEQESATQVYLRAGLVPSFDRSRMVSDCDGTSGGIVSQ